MRQDKRLKSDFFVFLFLVSNIFMKENTHKVDTFSPKLFCLSDILSIIGIVRKSKFSQSFYFTRYQPYFQNFTKNIFKKKLTAIISFFSFLESPFSPLKIICFTKVVPSNLQASLLGKPLLPPQAELYPWYLGLLTIS